MISSRMLKPGTMTIKRLSLVLGHMVAGHTEVGPIKPGNLGRGRIKPTGMKTASIRIANTRTVAIVRASFPLGQVTSIHRSMVRIGIINRSKFRHTLINPRCNRPDFDRLRVVTLAEAW